LVQGGAVSLARTDTLTSRRKRSPSLTLSAPAVAMAQAQASRQYAIPGVMRLPPRAAARISTWRDGTPVATRATGARHRTLPADKLERKRH